MSNSNNYNSPYALLNIPLPTQNRGLKTSDIHTLTGTEIPPPMAVGVCTHTHTDPWTPYGTTARPATRTFTESDGQISNRRLLTKRLSP